MIRRLDRDYTESDYNPDTGESTVVDKEGHRGVKTMRYEAHLTTKDGKLEVDTMSCQHLDDLERDVRPWMKSLQPNELILIYQAENYQFPGQEMESDLALVKMIPEQPKWFKIAKGFWTDKNLPKA